jgi:C-terminal processing protease CtpA/Prc
MLYIKTTEAGSIAREGRIKPGEALIAVNGAPIADIFDYRFHANASTLEMLIRGVDGKKWILEVERSYFNRIFYPQNSVMLLTNATDFN